MLNRVCNHNNININSIQNSNNYNHYYNITWRHFATIQIHKLRTLANLQIPSLQLQASPFRMQSNAQPIPPRLVLITSKFSSTSVELRVRLFQPISKVYHKVACIQFATKVSPVVLEYVTV